MATSRIAKFITEAAPPQYISVMRHRASKMLDTINEEERDASSSNPVGTSPRSPPTSDRTSAASAAAAMAATAATNTNYLSRRVQRSFSIFEN